MHYPWQISQWQQLMSAQQAARLPHALLFAGIPGIGKEHFALNLVRTLLCEARANYSCQECHSCHLANNRAHPNIFWLEPEKAGGMIKIDQVRDVIDFVTQSSLKGQLRFVIINPADYMNVNASNALLKTLEEPANDAILILISSETRRMLPTIISRCQRIFFNAPEKQLALDWLQQHTKANNPELLLRLTKGAPLAAITLWESDYLQLRDQLYQALSKGKNINPIVVAAECADIDALNFIDLLLTWVMDLLSLHFDISSHELINQDYAQVLENLKPKTVLANINEYLRYLQQLRGQVASGFNLNKQLLTETILIKWLNLFMAEA